MQYLYVSTKSNVLWVRVPFVPLSLEERKKMEEDRFFIINSIFGDVIQDEYEPICTMLVDAIKYSIPEYWDEAGEMLLSLKTDYYDKWANHCFRVADGIRRRGSRKTKKVIPFYGSKFKMLLEGVV